MFHHIKIIPLLVGLTMGIIAILYIVPEKEITYKYPNPTDKEPTIYKDKNGICYKYVSTAVDCDKNEGKLKNFPLSK